MHQLYVKHIHDFKLAHLYEHIVFDYLCNELAKANYISNIDYDFTPHTSFDGVVTISVWAANSRVLATFRSALDSDSKALTSSSIRRCVGQIACEKLSESSYDLRSVEAALRKISAQAWHDIEDAVVDVGRPAARSSDIPSPYFSYTKAPQDFDHVVVSYAVKEETYRGSPARLYIVDQFVKVMQDELRHALAREAVAAYWTGTSLHRSKRRVRIVQKFTFPKPADEQGFTRALGALEWLGRADATKRLARSLLKFDTQPTYAIEANSALYNALGIVVGIKTWRFQSAIATRAASSIS